MNVEIINEMLQTVGFPIAVCIALFWVNRETVKHYESIILEFRKSIDSNTAAIDKLTDKLKG